MPEAVSASPDRSGPTDPEVIEAWRVVLAASRHDWADSTTPRQERARQAFALDDDGRLRPVPFDRPSAVVSFDADSGWQSLASANDPTRPFLDLYLPLCGGSSGAPIIIGHLGQSLDGFIATHDGESQWITGHENLLHMHRLRAICDAVVVGGGTVAADDPQLTTRLVPGPSPLRAVLDPGRRLDARSRVFSDAAGPTIYLCARQLVRPTETRMGQAEIVAIDGTPHRLEPEAVVQHLRARGCRSIFIEGGGVTVSSFLDAQLLDRLHVAVAPLIIGDGRPAIRLPAPSRLGSCDRPPTRIFRMGRDVLFDCDVRANRPGATSDGAPHSEDAQPIARVY